MLLYYFNSQVRNQTLRGSAWKPQFTTDQQLHGSVPIRRTPIRRNPNPKP